MAKVREQWWVSKSDQDLGGGLCLRGELVRPSGARNDGKIFQDNSHWAFPFHGPLPDECGTDGCRRRFIDDAALNRHRLQAHAPERDAREQARLERIQMRVEAEQIGDTIGGHPVETVKHGPGGPVPYVRA